jgi:putative ABC transport system permease protein
VRNSHEGAGTLEAVANRSNEGASARRPILKLSLAGIRSNRGRFALLSFSVFIGVLFIAATLTITDTVKAGFGSLFSDAYRNVSVVVREQSEVVRQNETFRGRIDEGIVADVAKVPGVAAALPRITGYAYVVSASGVTPANVSSDTAGAPIAENWVGDAKLNPFTLVDGTAPRSSGDVVIDRGTAKEARIAVGDEVSVVTKDGAVPGRVSGIVRFGSVDSPGAVPVVLFPTDDAQRLLGEPDRIDAVMVRATPGTTPTALEKAIAAKLPDGIEAVTGAKVTAERESAVAGGLRFVTAFLLIFAVLSLVVGAFIIANTFSMSISQRTRELALLRAVGSARAQIARMVLGEAAVMAVVGSLLGLLGGVGLAQLMKSVLRATGVDLPPSPLVVRGVTVAWSLGIGMLVTVGAAIMPAIRAARISPVAAMRDSEIEPPPLLRRTMIGFAVLAVGSWITRKGALAPSLSTTGSGVALLFAASVLLAPAIGSLARFLVEPVGRLFGTTSGLAVRNATRNPRRTAATALALSLGSAVACFALILNSSLSQSLRTAVGGGLRGDLVVRSGAFGVGGLPVSLANEIAALPSVEAVSGLRYGFATVDGPKRAARRASVVRRSGGRPIASLDPASADRLLDFGNERGSFGDLGNNTIAISQRELDDRGWNFGDTLQLTFPGRPAAPFRINAIFRQGIAFDFAISHADYERSVPDQFDFVVYLAAKSGSNVPALREEISTLAKKYPTAKVEDPKQYVARITNSLDQLLSLILGLLILVVTIAVLGIAITLSLSVVERTREIGLLRTLGMSRVQVRSMLRSEAVVISLLAVGIGVVLGIGSAWALLKALRDEGLTRFSVPSVGVASLAVLAAFTGLLASVVPGRRAAGLPMLAALNGRQGSVSRSSKAETITVSRARRVGGVVAAAGLLLGVVVGRATAPDGVVSVAAPTVPNAGPVSTTTQPTPGATASTDNAPYVVPPSTSVEKPGVLRQAVPIDSPPGTKAWRVLYDSTIRDDRPTVVSGLVFAPDRPAPTGGWPVLSFAHPTTGLADRCAPSRNVGILETTIATLASQTGMAVVATDYPGLGTDGPHPFLDGVSEGRSVLDIARAATSIDGLSLSTTTVLWGHSQGGHAALFAAQQAPTYAPTLNVVGVVAGAPPSQLRELLTSIERTPERGYALVVAEGLRAIDPSLRLEDVFTARGVALAKRLETECSSEVNSSASRDTIRLSSPVPESWLRALDANQPGTTKIDAPVLIIHGADDELIPVDTSATLEKALRDLGTNVERKVYPGAGHADVALTSLTDVLAWITKRLPTSGGTAVSNPPTTQAKWPGATGRLRDTLARGEQSPLVIAHAGGDLEAPHSTPYAFNRAAKLGVDVLELDVRLSSDGVLVVHHDPDVDRTTNETGPAGTRSAEELAALDNANWFQPGCWDCRKNTGERPLRGVRLGTTNPPAGTKPDDFKIATLDEILAKHPDKVIDIEIKTDGPGGGAPVAEALAKRLRADDAPDRFVVVSFDDATIEAFTKLAPEIATSPGFGALTRYVLSGVVPANTPLIQVPPEAQGLPIFTDTLRAKAAADGIAIWVWPSDSTTDNAENYANLLKQKPNGIIAGQPQALLQLLGRAP